MSVLTERNRPSDFLKRFWDINYNFDSGTIKNTAGVALAAGALYCGLPLLKNGTQWETVAAADVANFDGFYVDEACSEALAIGATSEKKYMILSCGPALVNLDQVGDDPAGDAYNLTTVLTAMRAFSPPIQQLREPATVTEQTT